jgi:MFS family permease
VTSSPDESARPRHDPLAALRQPNFLLYIVNRVLGGVGQSLLQAVMAWQVYEVSGSALNLGFLGLVRFLPALALSLVGGMVADSYNRRNIMLLSQVIPLACTVVLAVATLGDWVSISLIFAMALLMGLASSFESPARTAILPGIVRPETFANAVTVNTTLSSIGMVSGPALGGGVIGVAGIGAAYSVFCVLTIASLVPLVLIRYHQSDAERRAVSIAALKEGVQFVRRRQALLGAMTLDMFAVIFGGAQALLPIYASDILHVGALGYGVLSASTQVGALLMSVGLVVRPPIKQTGRALVYSIVLYGLATMVFGISRNYALSVAFYTLIGAADQISVVMRHTMIQLATPDDLRGRVSAVNQVFVSASGQIGAMRAGFVAAVTSATFAVVSGGLGAVLVAAFLGWKMRDLFNYRIPQWADAEALPAPRPASAAEPPIDEPAPAAGGS